MDRSNKSRPSSPILPPPLSFTQLPPFSASPPPPSPDLIASFLSPANSSFNSRSSSPTLVYAYTTASPSPSLRISIGRSSSSPVRSSVSVRKRTCMCSPTTHSGSFRCRLHRSKEKDEKRLLSSSPLNLRRSAMKNSLVRIGTVEGNWVRRLLTALIRPSSHQLRRRSGFRPRRSRLSILSNAEDSVAVVV
ncbi:hypothetical protein Drorol1_Dr00002766 [Drosera rotundifolia]